MSKTKDDYEAIWEQYLPFCASPLRSKADIRADFTALVNNPFVTHIGFYSSSVIMVGTTNLQLTFDRVTYDIGELIYFLVRIPKERSYDTNFRFLNVTRSYPHGFMDSENLCYHPHIIAHASKDVCVPTVQVGTLCISVGQMEVYEYLRKGIMNPAVLCLRGILSRTKAGAPYRDVTQWPVAKPEDKGVGSWIRDKLTWP